MKGNTIMSQITVSKLTKVFERPAEGRRKAFESLKVLDGVDFSVERNEFISILGPSGCGKSTLLRLLAGLDADYDGNVGVDGVSLKECRVPVCYMLQKDYLMPWRTLIENVLLPLEIQGADLKSEAGKLMPLLEEFGLRGFESYRPHALSGGMRQRAALLRTYLMKGDIMLLDEPFGALDEITRMQMQDWLLDVWDRHKKTVVFVTHNIDEAIFLSDRVLVMSARPGHIVRELEISFQRPRDREMFLSGRFLNYKREILESLK